MTRRFSLFFLFLNFIFCGSTWAADPLPSGEALARSIRDALPTENAIIDATMEVTLRDRTRVKTSLNIQTKRLGQAECLMTYETNPARGDGVYWEVHRTMTKPNRYRIGKKAKRLAKPVELHIGLAKSAFTLADLGLEFLHWPNQKTIRKQRRKSRACYVLESSRPSADGGRLLRVVTWVDIKSGGILAADFFSSATTAKKRFSVKGLTKKDGQWQVDEMEMIDVEGRTRSRLRFHLK